MPQQVPESNFKIIPEHRFEISVIRFQLSDFSYQLSVSHSALFFPSAMLYSLRNAFTGLAMAALADSYPTVIQATNKVIAAVNAKTSPPICTR